MSTNKPNIIFILIDDMGWMDLTCQGSSFYETPNIDALAKEGMRFTDAYAACPVCSPTRASILTGKYPARLGLTNFIGGHASGELLSVPYIHYLPLEEKSVASALKDQGYNTFHVGKWHLGNMDYWPENHGFDENVGGCSWGSPAHGYFSPYGNPRLDDGPEGEYLTDRLTDEAISLIKGSKDEPFFLYMSYYSVHIPIQVPEAYKEKYEAKARALGLDKEKTFEDGDNFPTMHKHFLRIKRRLIQSDPAYAGMIEKLDENIGRLTNALKHLGIDENTIIFFFSDNGGLSTAESSPTCNFPLSEGKGWMYEGGTREPLIVRWSGKIKPGTTCTHPVTSTDFYPTMLEMANAPLLPDQHVDGVSIMPLLDQSGKPDRDAIFWHYPHYSNQGGTPGASIREGDYKLIEFFEDMHVELYDLRDDVEESNDLSDELPEVVERLRAKLHAWRDEVNAAMPEKNPDWPYCLHESYVRVTGEMKVDEEGACCIHMQLTKENPMLYDVPIWEILEDYMEAPVLLKTSRGEAKVQLHVTDDGICVVKDIGTGEEHSLKDYLQSDIGSLTTVKAWLLQEGDEGYDPSIKGLVNVEAHEGPTD